MVPLEAADVLDATAKALESEGFEVHRDGSGIRPSIIAHHPLRGVIALDYTTGSPSAGVELNRKLELLREEIPAIRRTSVTRRVIDGGRQATERTVLTIADVASGEWVSSLAERPLDESVRDGIRNAYAPRIELQVPRRGAIGDDGAAGRAAARLRLDADQSRAVEDSAAEVGIVEGPPGSGKTIVLVARAERLAREHPDWHIQFVCFNSMLVPYLSELVRSYPNIHVGTFAKFVSTLGQRVNMKDPEQSAADARRVAPRLKQSPAIDALMIDEAQDFWLPWLEVAFAALRPGRGGAMLAGDPMQSLYRYESGIDEFKAWIGEYALFELHRPYRSTRQILEVTSALNGQRAIAGIEGAFDGPPVDLVYAHSKDGQGETVAYDIARLTREGVRYQDIGVLVTRRWWVGTVARALEAHGIPHNILWANNSAQLDLREPKVKILTVHSAKGLDFDAVFLVGLESLPDGDTPADVQQGRAGYVGMTRAKDKLVITYSKDNGYLDRIRHVDSETLNRQMWPDDLMEA